jgi:hypothetical protein
VIIISPNFGEIGAPQLGHFSAVAPAGAMTGWLGLGAWLGAAVAILVPHFMQKPALSGSWVPQLGQNSRLASY